MREFADTSEPVSSKELYLKYDFKVKPATIRNELNLLTEEGLLYQPYTSGGRMPTDKSYRFIADRILKTIIADKEIIGGGRFASLTNEFISGAFEDFVSDVSEELNILSAGFSKTEETVYKSGLDDLFEHLVSYLDSNEMLNIIQDFEGLDQRMGNLKNFVKAGDAPKVFIGRSPITKSRHLSVIAECLESDGDEFFIAALGPKRMDYKKGLNFFVTIRDYLEK